MAISMMVATRAAPLRRTAAPALRAPRASKYVSCYCSHLNFLRLPHEPASRANCADLSIHRSRRFSSTNAADSQAKAQEGGFFSSGWKIPAALGFSLIGFLQFYHLNHPTEEERKAHPAPALRRLPGEQTAFEHTMATERQLQSLKLIPYRAVSRLWGQVHDKELYVRY